MPGRSKPLKFIRDPIHDIIRIQDPFILQLLDTRVMQRLRRIRQLGFAWLVYPGAEHSRFTHSLGVLHLAERVMTQLEQEAGVKLFDDGHREAVLAAALLHDVGHGPFSHVFEHVSADVHGGAAAHHEDWTAQVINNCEEVRKCLEAVSAGLPNQVLKVLDHTYKPHYVTAILSSQLDVDRFDYLLRDSHMTGAHYGAFDLEWMLRTLAVRDVPPIAHEGAGTQLQTIVVDGQRGLSGLEQYLIGRHYMYQHVCFHKTSRSAEQMLGAILARAAQLVKEGNRELGNAAFRRMAQCEVLPIEEYLSLNDFIVMAWIEEWARFVPDPILGDLSARLLNRRLLKAVVAPPQARRPTFSHNMDRLKEIVKRHGYDPRYYMLEDGVEDIAFKGYMYNLEQNESADEKEIWFVDRKGSPHRLSSSASVLTQAASALQFDEDRWFVPEEIAKEADRDLKW